MTRDLLIEKFKPDYIDDEGKCVWFDKNGYFHRDGDNPAVITSDGCMFWYRNGLCHRDGNKPAIINRIRMYWCKEGRVIKEMLIL